MIIVVVSLFSKTDRDGFPLNEMESLVETAFDEYTGEIIPVQTGVSPQLLGAVWNVE